MIFSIILIYNLVFAIFSHLNSKPKTMERTTTQKMKKLIFAGALALAAFSSQVLQSQDYDFEQVGNIVVIEAENYTEQIKPAADEWVPIVEPVGFSGTGAMMAVAASAFAEPADAIEGSPILVYAVEFNEPAEFFIWVRGARSADNPGGTDSFHAGVDGTIEPTGDMIAFENMPWEYENGTWGWQWWASSEAAAQASVVVQNSGTHNLEIYIRENGYMIDKIVLTTDPYADGTGWFPWIDGDTLGPAETPNTTGILSAKLNNEALSVHPNPADDMVQIRISDGAGSANMIEIYDITGKMMRRVSADYRRNMSLDVSGLAAGLYYVRLERNNKPVSVRKMLKR
jgi:hypothetical protein